MKVSKIRITVRSLIKFMFILTILYMIFLPPRINAVLYPVRILAILNIALIGIVTIYHHKNRFRVGEILAFYVIIAIIFCGFVAYNIVPNIDNILSVLSILCFLLLVSVSDCVIIDRSLVDFVYRCSVIMALVEIVYAQTDYAYWNGTKMYAYLLLGIENANLTAMFLFLIYALLVITMGGQKHKLLAMILEINLIWMIFQTNSRGVIIAVLFLSIVASGRIRRIPRFAVLGGCIVPFIFVPFYLGLYQRLDNFEILGKSIFSGRQYNFTNYLSMVDTPMKQLFGNLGMNMFQNAHNGPLAIYTAIGLIGTVAFYYILIKRLVKASERASSMGNVAIVAILSCFLHSCGEAALFLGGFPGIVFMFAMFVFTHTPVELSK